MVDATQIKEHAEVVGSDGQHVGTVDHMEGADRIKLTKSDRGAAGKHHYLPLGLIEDVDGGKARASFKAELAEDFWEAEDA